MGRCEMALDVERVVDAAWVDKNFSAEPALLKLLLRATSIVAIRNDGVDGARTASGSMKGRATFAFRSNRLRPTFAVLF